jgi:mannose-6-phosphate isomerase-like protein (cupin superfamily)
MRNFLKLASGFDVTPIMLELHRSPGLWDENTHRQSYPGTPHADTNSVWVRYRPAAEIKDLRSFAEQHRNVFWPAWRELPSLRPLVFGLMTRVSAVELGSILITRIPLGGEVRLHSDKGSWAPEFYNTKVHVTLAGSSESTCDGEVVTMVQGDIFTFDNLRPHSVLNNGDRDRIVCIISMRCEP